MRVAVLSSRVGSMVGMVETIPHDARRALGPSAGSGGARKQAHAPRPSLTPWPHWDFPCRYDMMHCVASGHKPCPETQTPVTSSDGVSIVLGGSGSRNHLGAARMNSHRDITQLPAQAVKTPRGLRPARSRAHERFPWGYLAAFLFGTALISTFIFYQAGKLAGFGAASFTLALGGLL